MDEVNIYPAKHFVTPKDRRIPPSALSAGAAERLMCSMLKESCEGPLEQRTKLTPRCWQVGYCNGGENYARHLSGRGGHTTGALIDYFPDDWLLIVDESHVTRSQLQAMYNGHPARKKVLIERSACQVLLTTARRRGRVLGESGVRPCLSPPPRRLGDGGERW